MLSYIFGGLIVLSLIVAPLCGNTGALSQSVMDAASEAVEVLVKMSGMLILWSGFMKIAERAGLSDRLARLFSPLLGRLYPQLDRNSKAFSYISMNVSANLLGLGSAATPLGIAAMRELKGDSRSSVASDAMVTLVVMNTASIQLIPTTMAALRRSYGSSHPFDVIFCVWLSSAAALAVGLTAARLLRGRRRWSS